MPAYPSDNSGIKIKMNTDLWWIDTDRGNSSTARETVVLGGKQQYCLGNSSTDRGSSSIGRETAVLGGKQQD